MSRYSILFLLGLSFCSPLSKDRAQLAAPSSPGIQVVNYSLPGASPNSSACSKHPAYAGLHGTLQISIVFGYKDTRPSRFVADLFEKISLVNQLKKPCQNPSQKACGFEQDPDDLNLFQKFVTTPGGSERILLRIVSSAVSANDDENRVQPEQRERSHLAEKEFLAALSQADAVFYIGHSRDGGGPDFYPPRLTRDKHVDYPFYVKSKESISKVLKTLRGRPKEKPLLLGMMSCSSTSHFAGELTNAFEKLTLISSSALIYYTDALSNTLSALDAFMNRKCAAEISKSLKSPFSKLATINIKGLLTVPSSGTIKKPSNKTK